MSRIKGLLDLNLLRLLVTLQATGSVDAAARRLEISSHSARGGLAELRAYFGDRLFVGPTFETTQVGRQVCAVAHQSLEVLDAGMKAVVALPATPASFALRTRRQALLATGSISGGQAN
ncbi:LysR family transcriptional regulator [Caenimonas sedimenti]|uniref:LysR family transcriptional regulator n=1 Tax=Caenimonas sedimenti TaxID=2596921 RepID=UPI0016486EEE|nr:LysR family transcriptional regulator [Caenimonas sedimenti]